MTNFKAIVLDMDGTIFDTEKLIIDTFIKTFEKFDIHLSNEESEWLIGKSIRQMTDFSLQKIGKVNEKKAYELFSKEYNDYIINHGTPCKLGLNELISYAKNSGIRLAIATSASRKVFDLNFKHSGLDINDFEVVCTLDDVKKAKPDKEIYETACKKLGLNPSECLAVEDSYTGILSAKSAGLVTCKVKDLETTNEELDKNVDYKVYDLLELIRLIDFLKMQFTEKTFKGNCEIMAQINKCSNMLDKYNKIPNSNTEKADKMIRKILGSVGENPNIRRPFNCDKGIAIEVGNNFFANSNVRILDEGKVIFGDDCKLAPNVIISNIGHAFDRDMRKNAYYTTSTIYVGNNVWIGAGSIILQGVKIGDNAIIGAGSVVTNDVMPNTIVVGNPARFLRFIF